MSLDVDIFDIAEAIEKLLITKLPIISPEFYQDFDPSQIVYAIDDVPNVKGDFDIVLKLNSEQNIYSIDDGGGRAAMRCSQTIDIFVRTSSALSQIANDKVKIRKHVKLKRSVLDALAGVMLANNDGYDLLTKPLQWRGTSLITKKTHPAAKNLWSQTAMTLECHFRPLIRPLELNG